MSVRARCHYAGGLGRARAAQSHARTALAVAGAHRQVSPVCVSGSGRNDDVAAQTQPPGALRVRAGSSCHTWMAHSASIYIGLSAAIACAAVTSLWLLSILLNARPRRLSQPLARHACHVSPRHIAWCQPGVELDVGRPRRATARGDIAAESKYVLPPASRTRTVGTTPHAPSAQ